LKQEVELKLELPQDAVEAFGRSAFLPAECDEANLQAAYFDTPDKQLKALGYTLRIRRSGDKRVQTVKAGYEGGGGLFARAEWEMPVTQDEPVIDTRTPIAGLLGDDADSIAPAFHVDVERRTWLITEDKAEIELVLDRGVVRAGERQAPICEIELESKAGEPYALFSLARRIEQVVPVRLGVAAKSERGYRLLESASAFFKAEPVMLKPGSRAEDAFQTVARACVRHYRLNEGLLLDHYDPLALHQARVAVRRLRSALTLFKPMLEEADVTRFQDELRWLAKLLGEARDLDVLVERTAPGILHDRIDEARATVHGKVIEALKSQRARGMMIDIVEWLTLGAGHMDCRAGGLGDELAEQFTARRLQHFHHWVVKHGRKMAKLNDEQRHEIRKKAKKLRYASEFFGGLFTGEKKERRRPSRYIKTLEVLQDQLGALNDLVSAPGLLAQHGLSGDAGAVKGRGAKKKLIAAAADAHADLAEAKRFWR
jgi:inorganic triphosphatase YgiF